MNQPSASSSTSADPIRGPLATSRLAPLALACALALIGRSARAEDIVITVLHTNDIHGHLFPGRDDLACGLPRPVIGGASALARVISDLRHERSSDGGLILVDGGDIFHGTPEGDLTRGRAIVDFMRLLGYDAVAVGNHEFAYGVDGFLKLTGDKGLPWLAANIRATDRDDFDKAILKVVEKRIRGLRIAIVGITTPRCAALNLPDNTRGLRFDSPFTILPPLVKKLSDDGCLVIVVTHHGSQADDQLAPLIPGATIIAGGHDHVVISRPWRADAPFVAQTGEYLRRVGRIDLRLSIDNERPRSSPIVREARAEVLNLTPSERDTTTPLELAVELFLEDSRFRSFDVTVASARHDFRRDPQGSGDGRLGALIAEAMCTASGAELAFVGYGGIRGSLAAGPVTLRDLYLVYPFDDPLRVLELTGAELVKAFRGSLDSGRLDLGACGLTFTYDLTRPLNSRISDLQVRGKPLKANERTTLVVTEFLLQRLLVERRVRPESIRELDTTVYQALLQHCQARPDPSAAGGSLLSAALAERGDRVLGTIPEPTIVQALVASPPRLWQTHKIPLNTASEELLASLPWIGNELATAIVAERDRRGGFRSLEDLKDVEGLSDDLYKKLERILTLP